MIKLSQLNNVVISVSDLQQAKEFYSDTLGLNVNDNHEEGLEVNVGDSNVYLRENNEKFEPRAHNIAYGSADFAIETENTMEEVVEYLGSKGILLNKGPVDRIDQSGPRQSVYFRDPDDNLIEITTYNVVDFNREDLNPKDQRTTAPHTQPGLERDII